MSVCHCTAIAPLHLGSGGSYTDSLVGGINRLGNRAYARPALKTALLDTRLDECNGLCPLGTICALDTGIPRCVPRTAAAAVIDGSYGTSNIGLNGGLRGDIGLISGAAPIATARFGSNGYGRSFGVSVCGFMAPECRATSLNINSVYKYTFDHTLNRCVRVAVCMTCANFNSPQDNLFNNRFQCARYCH